jgi:hypothetical protein
VVAISIPQHVCSYFEGINLTFYAYISHNFRYGHFIFGELDNIVNIQILQLPEFQTKKQQMFRWKMENKNNLGLQMNQRFTTSY